MDYLLFIVGLALLIKGADWLVDGSSSLAKKFNVSSLVIGLTVVAFGTSAPELVVNIVSALSGQTELAFGNVIGSNISNILLILGLAALIVPLRVGKSTVWKEIPFALLAVITTIIFVNTHVTDDLKFDSLFRFEGLIYILFFIIFLYYIIQLARRNTKDEEMDIDTGKSKTFYTFLSLFGLGVLIFGGQLTVTSAVSIARTFGISEYLIALTIVSIGTSLPELVTSIVSVTKKRIDLAVGNIIGSNIFNIFLVLGITTIVSPVRIPVVANIDLAILFIVTTFLFLFMFIGKKHILERWQGVIFVLGYISYIAYIILR